MNSPAVVVTTSWDDGHVLDFRLAEMLRERGLAGTFYIAPRNIEIEPSSRLTDEALVELSEDFEIGGHTLTHQRLPFLAEEEARDEIVSGKQALEDVLGTAVTSFCYPRGEYGPEHVRIASSAGFAVARTVRRGCTAVGSTLEMPTTVHAYQHLVDGPRSLGLAGTRPWRALRLYFEWDRMAMRWFDLCLQRGGVYHLWGHSWEIDERGDWDRLERVLDYISGRADVDYLTNGEAGRTA